MAKRSVKLVSPEDVNVTSEPVLEPTDEQEAEWEEEARRIREQGLAPYRAMHDQQVEQDELIADLMFKETMRELEG